MKTEEQLTESIERFRHSFWERRSGGRPPVGVVDQGIYLPIQYLRQEFTRPEVQSEDLTPELAMTDYEFGFANRAVSSDDWIPFTAPWRAIPWLEAWCGCRVLYSSGSLAPARCIETLDELGTCPLPARREWFDCLERQTERLVATAPGDCWVSPTILRGPSDVLAALRGLTHFYTDLVDDIGLVDRAAERINRLLIQALDQHFSIVRPKLGGYGHIFGYWAPSPTITIQEDALGMCRPSVYRDVFMKYSAAVVQHLGLHVLFHLHSTGCRHYRDVLRVPGLAGLQLIVESNGPSLRDLVPMLREILEQSRLILTVEQGLDQLPEVLNQIPQEGLYLIIPSTQIGSEQEFRRFLAKHWC